MHNLNIEYLHIKLISRAVIPYFINFVTHDLGMIFPIPNIEVNVVSVEFENETVVVTLVWTMENGALSGLSIVPQVEIVNLGPSSRQLVISYNSSYNVSVMTILCGQNSSQSIELHYSK